MPPEPVSGFCILPRAATMSSTACADPVAVAVVGALELAERRRVEVQPLDADADLVGPQLAAGVEPVGGLREHAGGCDHPVEADGAALLAHGCPLRQVDL